MPFVATLVISFMNWNALHPNDRGFAGVGNYVTAFTDQALRSSIITTIVLTVAVVLVSLRLGLALHCCWTGSSAAAGSCAPS